MTIEECYQNIGGDYTEVCQRLLYPKLIAHFLTEFPEDNSFTLLCEGMQNGDRMQAFRAAHTLKGLCQNLNLGLLLSSVKPLTDALRPDTPDIAPEAIPLFQAVERDYKQTVEAIRLYQTQRTKEPIR